MKRLFSAIMICLLCLSMFSMFAPRAQAEATTTSTRLPHVLQGAASVWDGTDAYIFGGTSHIAGVTNQILKYNPDTDSISSMSALLPEPVTDFPAVWAGQYAYIFGGYVAPLHTSDNIVRYDPSTDTTTVMGAKISTYSFPLYSMPAIWDGNYAYLFGGYDGYSYYDQILRYDPVNDQITMMNAKLPTGTKWMPAVWSGTYAYIFGGRTASGASDQVVRYDPASDSITMMSARLPVGILVSSAVWAGSCAYVFGGSDINNQVESTILRYDPSLDSITAVDNLPSPRRFTCAIWDGNSAYVFGGEDANGQDLDEIVKFTPNTVTTLRVGVLLTNLHNDLYAVHLNRLGVSFTEIFQGDAGTFVFSDYDALLVNWDDMGEDNAEEVVFRDALILRQTELRQWVDSGGVLFAFLQRQYPSGVVQSAYDILFSAGSVAVYRGEPFDPSLFRYVMETDPSAVEDSLVTTPNLLPSTISTGVCSYGWFASWASGWAPIFRDDQEHVIAVAKRSGRGLYMATCFTLGDTSVGTDLLENIMTNPSQRSPTKWAVILGINEYSAPPNGKGGPINSANDMYDLLINKFSFPKANVHLRTDTIGNSADDINTRDVENELNWLIESVIPGDTAVFYHAGHGSQGSSGTEYLVPHDQIGITDSDFATNYANKINTEKLLIILDMSYSGGFVTDGQNAQQGLNGDFASYTDLAEGKPSGRLVLTACAQNTSCPLRIGRLYIEIPKARDAKERNFLYPRLGLRSEMVFTHYLVEGFKGSADSNKDGKVTVEEAFTYAKPKAYTGGIPLAFVGLLYGQTPLMYDGYPTHGSSGDLYLG